MIDRRDLLKGLAGGALAALGLTSLSERVIHRCAPRRVRTIAGPVAVLGLPHVELAHRNSDGSFGPFEVTGLLERAPGVYDVEIKLP